MLIWLHRTLSHVEQSKDMLKEHNKMVDEMRKKFVEMAEEQLLKQKARFERQHEDLESQFQRQLQAEENKTTTLEADMSNLASRQADLDSTIISLSHQKKDLESAKNQLETDFKGARGTIDSINQQINDLTLGQTHLKAQLQDQQTRASTLEQDKSSLAALKSTLETELQGAKTKIDSINLQNDDLTLAKTRIEEQLQDQQTKTSALEQDKSSLAAAKSTLETELQGAETRIDSVNQQNNDLTSVKTGLEKQLRDEQAKTSDLEQDRSNLTTTRTTLETDLQHARARVESVNQQNNALELAKTGLEGRLRDEQGKTSALEQDKTGLKTSNDTLNARVRELEQQLAGEETKAKELDQQLTDERTSLKEIGQQLTDKKTSNDGLVSTVNENKAAIERLTMAVQYQVATFADQAADSQDVEKIAELLAKPQISVSTPTRVLPTLIFNRTAIRAQSASAPYLLWVASRYGSLDAVFEHAEGIFNTALVPHAAQLWWIVDAVERLASRWTADIKVAMLLLQGVAYVRSSMPSYSPDTLMQGLNQYIDNLPDEFIVRSMYQKVSSFLEQGQLITSWLPNTAPGVRMLDHNNSALADNVQLIADKNGLLVLNQATNAGIITYVFEKGDIESLEFKEGALPLLRMKSAGVCRVPQELQDLQLAQVSNGMDALTFVYTYLLPF